MDGSNIQHFFEKLDRSLKRLGIVLVDDFEEVKKGVPAPIVALVRKLLFNTSTIVMKYMLLRGCPSHVSDKKVVISLFDLLRETVKYSPPISIDQFFNTGFGQHKVVILTKLAEYVAHIDRMAGRSGNKTAFVVHNEVLQSLAAHDDDAAAAAAAVAAEPAPPVGSDLVAPVVSSPSASHSTAKRPSSATRSPLAAVAAAPTTFGQRRSLSSQRAAMRSSSTAAAPGSPLQASAVAARDGHVASPIADQFNAAMILSDVDAPPQPPTAPTAPTARTSADSDRPAAPAIDLSQFVSKSDVQALVEAAVQSQLQQTVREISEKYDFVINKLVAAVDAEFTLLNNRLKQLETALAVAPVDGAAAGEAASPAAAAEQAQGPGDTGAR